MKEYKRKRSIEENCSDKRAPKVLEGSERERGKRICRAEEEACNYDIEELKWEIEEDFATKCYKAEQLNPDHKCACPDPHSWTDEEVLRYLGYTD